MQPYRVFSWIVLCAVSVLGPQLNRTEAEELRYKFEPGQKLLFRMTQMMSMSFSGEGLPPDHEVTIENVTDMVWTVQKVQDDGTAQINQLIQRMKHYISAPPASVLKYDSATGDDPAGSLAGKMKPLFTAMVGATFGVTMNNRGEVLQVQVPDQVAEVLEKVPGASQVGEMFSKEGLEKVLQRGGLVLPEGDLEPGREWTTSFQMPSPGLGGTQSVSTTYRNLGQEEVDGQTLDAFAVDLQMDFGEEPAAAGTKVTVKSQESSGKIYFDRQAGRMHSSRIDMSMDLQIETLGRSLDAHMTQQVAVDVRPAVD